MALTLTERDLEEISGTIESLSNPAALDSPTAWRTRITERVRCLLGGEMTVLCGEGIGGDPPIDLGRMRAFLAPPTEVTLHDRAWVDGGQVYATKEFRRIRSLTPDREPTSAVLHVIGLATWGPAGGAYLSVLRARSAQWRFGEETKFVARLLLPAFRTGVAALAHGQSGDAATTSWLEGARDSVAIYDVEGQVPLATNASYQRLRASASDEAALRRTITDLVKRLPKRPGMRKGERSTACEHISLSAGEVTVRATWVAEAAPLPSAGILVSVVPDRPIIPSAPEIEARFGLSAREAVVAQGLAAGESLAAIAATLHISPHTARHHGEAVFRKLAVHSQAALLRALVEGREG